MTEDKDLTNRDDAYFVARDQCQRVHLEVGLQLTSIDKKINGLSKSVTEGNDRIKTVCEDVYGRTELGEQKGGLVMLVRDTNKKLDTIIKNNGKAGLSNRDKAAIIIAVIGGSFGLFATIINAFGGQ